MLAPLHFPWPRSAPPHFLSSRIATAHTKSNNYQFSTPYKENAHRHSLQSFAFFYRDLLLAAQ